MDVVHPSRSVSGIAQHGAAGSGGGGPVPCFGALRAPHKRRRVHAVLCPRAPVQSCSEGAWVRICTWPMPCTDSHVRIAHGAELYLRSGTCRAAPGLDCTKECKRGFTGQYRALCLRSTSVRGLPFVRCRADYSPPRTECALEADKRCASTAARPGSL